MLLQSLSGKGAMKQSNFQNSRAHAATTEGAGFAALQLMSKALRKEAEYDPSVGPDYKRSKILRGEDFDFSDSSLESRGWIENQSKNTGVGQGLLREKLRAAASTLGQAGANNNANKPPQDGGATISSAMWMFYQGVASSSDGNASGLRDSIDSHASKAAARVVGSLRHPGSRGALEGKIRLEKQEP